MTAAAWVLVGLLVLTLILGWGIRFGRRAIEANHRINADGDVARPIPSGMNW